MRHLAIFTAASVALASGSASVATADVALDTLLAPDTSPVVVVHRSASLGDAPENTLSWIGAAIESGADAVHVNPQETADGHYVLMHDHTLNRTTNVTEVFPNGPPGGPTRDQRGGLDYVRDYTLDAIRQLHVLVADGVSGERVPTLGEALDVVDGRVLVVLGLKSYQVESLGAALEVHDTRNLLLFELYVSGTDQSKLRRLSERTGISASVTLFQSRDYLKDLNGIADQLGPHLGMVLVRRKRTTPEVIDRARELGVRIAISGYLTEDAALVEQGDPEPWLWALRRGFWAFTHYPGQVADLLAQ